MTTRRRHYCCPPNSELQLAETHGTGGMDIHPEQIGTNVIDLITGQIIGNEYGLPQKPKLVLSPSEWVEGTTLRLRAAE